MRRSLVLAACLALSVSACSSGPTVLGEAEAQRELVDRNWITRWPRTRDERLHVYRFVPSMANSGVYQDRTVFQGYFELFQFEATGSELRFHFPDNEERARTAYRIERVDGPAPFTRRLVLTHPPRGPEVYYGWDEGQRAAPFAALP